MRKLIFKETPRRHQVLMKIQKAPQTKRALTVTPAETAQNTDHADNSKNTGEHTNTRKHRTPENTPTPENAEKPGDEDADTTPRAVLPALDSMRYNSEYTDCRPDCDSIQYGRDSIFSNTESVSI